MKDPILSAVEAEGYTQPTPIQAQAIPAVLAGKDVLGCAQTGTGKTAAFSLPILQRFLTNPLPDKKQSADHSRSIRCLILSPTRELAGQIGECIAAYSKGSDLRHTVIFGGVRQHGQVKDLKHGVDIVVATPGRLMDLMNQGHVKLGALEVFILDEADRMLDMGFIDDIWRILAQVPEKRQSLLFSATMPYKIKAFANQILHDAVEVHIAPEMPAADTIEQRIYFVEGEHKALLLKHILEEEDYTRVLVFTQTKRRADLVTAVLKQEGLKVDAMHSDRPMHARKRALENFTSGKVPILIASDIAARGLDVDDISHVINYEMPQEAEVYVHRIGRTGRAGKKGIAISFCAAEERVMLDEIEKLLTKTIPVIEDHPHPSILPRGLAKTAVRATSGMARHRVPGRKRRLF
ncbi:MAG: DEAD/DEAH box helicase [Phycisphaerales bacterium]|nr:DEAD/DEAH box helicase [Phycisphaerales bacterium]MBT7170247.1 DEAD/DEAH box helicase [Phycisphaerales bacterium]